MGVPCEILPGIISKIHPKMSFKICRNLPGVPFQNLTGILCGNLQGVPSRSALRNSVPDSFPEPTKLSSEIFSGVTIEISVDISLGIPLKWDV